MNGFYPESKCFWCIYKMDSRSDSILRISRAKIQVELQLHRILAFFISQMMKIDIFCIGDSCYLFVGMIMNISGSNRIRKNSSQKLLSRDKSILLVRACNHSRI
jgi:hypothetical protein